MSTPGTPHNGNGTMPPPPSSPPPAPGGPSGQPAWAWWVVGIAVPLVGALATLLTVLNNNSDDDSGAGGAPSSPATQQNSPAASGTPTEEAGGQSGPTAAPTPSVRFGPGDLVVNSSYGASGYVDLDSVPLLVTGQSTDSSDLAFDPTATEPVDVEGQIAPLPAGGSEPSEAECVTQIQKNNVSELDLARGTAFCVQTGEGRTAYLRVVSAPVEGEGKVRLRVTVWDLPQ